MVGDEVESIEEIEASPMRVLSLVKHVDVRRSSMYGMLVRFNKLKDKLRKIKLQHYPGQNMTLLVIDVKDLYHELFTSNQYDESLTLEVLSNLSQGGGGCQLWYYVCAPMNLKLQRTLLEIGHMSRQNQIGRAHV